MDHKNRGFSLPELLISVGLLCVVIITICGVFMHGLDAIKKGKYRAAALHIANQKFSELNSIDWNDKNGLPTAKLLDPPTGYIEGYISAEPDSISYIPWDVLTVPEYKITGQESMAGVDYNFTIIIRSYRENLKQIIVTVYWQENNVERKVELCTFMARKG